MHVNVVHLIGYLGKNPEHKSVKASDRNYAVLSLATQRSWKGADEEWHSKTEWHRVVVIWNQPACQFRGEISTLQLWERSETRPVDRAGLPKNR
jgi:single-stranded DNA-binding protein